MSGNQTACPTQGGSIGEGTVRYLTSSPPERIAVLCVSAACFVFAMGITWLMFYRHARAGFEERKLTIFIPHVRKLVLTQILWVQITVFLAFCSLLFPLMQVVFTFIASSYQALALYWFIHLISAYVGGREGAIRVSKENGKTKLYAVPPFGCCFAPCHKPTFLTPRRLVWARFGVIQACGVQPTCTFIALFLRLEGLYVSGTTSASNGFPYLLTISLISTMISMYFVFVIQKGIGQALIPFKPKLKFLLVKIMIPLFALQAFIINFTYVNVHEGPDPIFPVALAPALYNQFITVLEGVPLVIILYFAYPVHGESDYHVHMKTAECQTDMEMGMIQPLQVTETPDGKKEKKKHKKRKKEDSNKSSDDSTGTENSGAKRD